MPSEAIELAIVLLAKDMASAELSKVGEHIGGMSNAAKLGLAAAAGLATAAVGVGKALFDMASESQAAAGEVRKLSRETGLSAEEASKLRFAGERLNIDTGDLSKSFGIFSKNIETQADKLKELGVEVVKSKDGHVDLGATIGTVADKFKGMPDGVEKTALAMQLFGRSGKDMIPLLNQGSDGLATLGEEAQKVGLVFNKEGVESARNLGLAQKDLNERIEGVKNTIGMAVIPVLLELFKWLGQIADVVGPAVITVFGGIKDVLAGFGDILGVVTGKSPAAGAALKNIAGDGAAPLMTAVASLRDTFAAMGERVQSVVAAIRAAIMPFVEQAVGALSRFWTEIQPKVTAAFDSIAQKVTWVVNTVVMPIIAFLAQFWNDHLQQIAAVGKAVFDTIVGVIRVAFDVISGIFRIVLDLLSGNWQGAWDDMLGMLRSVWDDIGGIFNSLAELGANLGQMAMDLGSSIVHGILDGLGALKDRLWSALTTAISNAMSGIHIDMGPLHFSAGGGFSLDRPSFPSFQHGTDFVRQTGLALVHQGERIIPAAQNAYGRGGGAPVNIYIESVDSEERVQRLASEIDAIYARRLR